MTQFSWRPGLYQSPSVVLQGSLMKKELPPNVHLLTLKLFDPSDPDTFLLWLEHQFEVSEAPCNHSTNM